MQSSVSYACMVCVSASRAHRCGSCLTLAPLRSLFDCSMDYISSHGPDSSLVQGPMHAESVERLNTNGPNDSYRRGSCQSECNGPDPSLVRGSRHAAAHAAKQAEANEPWASTDTSEARAKCYTRFALSYFFISVFWISLPSVMLMIVLLDMWLCVLWVWIFHDSLRDGQQTYRLVEYMSIQNVDNLVDIWRTLNEGWSTVNLFVFDQSYESSQ